MGGAAGSLAEDDEAVMAPSSLNAAMEPPGVSGWNLAAVYCNFHGISSSVFAPQSCQD